MRKTRKLGELCTAFSAFQIMKPDKLLLEVITKYCEDNLGTVCIFFRKGLKHALLGKNPISLDNSQCSCVSLFADLSIH